MTYLLEFPRVNSAALVRGVLRTTPEDFFVEEIFDYEFSGEGEHLYLFIEKIGQNTEYVAKQLARYLGVRAMDVSFSGLKDRWAVTRQWFSVYTSNKTLPDINDWQFDGVRVLKLTRHNKKLRRGEHGLNRFRIVVREVDHPELLIPSFERIKQEGVPNYFGVQRFGREGQNLERAVRWFAGDIKVNRSQRSFYLSAARSYLFNELLSRKIKQGIWNDLVGEGPLYGDPSPEIAPMTSEEQAFFDEFGELVKGLHKNRMTLARRPYKMRPHDFEWRIEEDRLGDRITFTFALPTGAFATSVLSEVFALEEISHVERSASESESESENEK